MDFDFDMTREEIGKTFISDQVNGEDTKVQIDKYGDCLWFFFGGDDKPAVLIDSVDGVIRVCIYEDDDMDKEPVIHPTNVIAGNW